MTRGGNKIWGGGGGCFAIHSVKPRTVPVVFVTEGSFDKFCNPGCPRDVLLGINLLIVLAMVLGPMAQWLFHWLMDW